MWLITSFKVVKVFYRLKVKNFILSLTCTFSILMTLWSSSLFRVFLAIKPSLKLMISLMYDTSSHWIYLNILFFWMPTLMTLWFWYYFRIKSFLMVSYKAPISNWLSLVPTFSYASIVNQQNKMSSCKWRSSCTQTASFLASRSHQRFPVWFRIHRLARYSW